MIVLEHVYAVTSREGGIDPMEHITEKTYLFGKIFVFNTIIYKIKLNYTDVFIPVNIRYQLKSPLCDVISYLHIFRVPVSTLVDLYSMGRPFNTTPTPKKDTLLSDIWKKVLGYFSYHRSKI